MTLVQKVIISRGKTRLFIYTLYSQQDLTRAQMNLYQLVYISKLPQPLSPKAFKYLIENAQLKNMENDVTGIMIKQGVHILQVLEGNRHTIQELFELIENDPRHINIHSCLFEPIETRRFGKWSMAFLNLDLGKYNKQASLKIKLEQLIEAKGEDIESRTQSFLAEFDHNVSQ